MTDSGVRRTAKGGFPYRDGHADGLVRQKAVSRTGSGFLRPSVRQRPVSRTATFTQVVWYGRRLFPVPAAVSVVIRTAEARFPYHRRSLKHLDRIEPKGLYSAVRCVPSSASLFPPHPSEQWQCTPLVLLQDMAGKNSLLYFAFLLSESVTFAFCYEKVPCILPHIADRSFIFCAVKSRFG